MREKRLRLIFVCIFLLFIAYPAMDAFSASGKIMALPVGSEVYVDSRPYKMNAYNIGGYTYYKLRALAYAANISVSYNKLTDGIYIDTAKPYDTNYSEDVLAISGQNGIQTAVPAKSSIIVDGVLVHIDCYTINGYIYFKLRDFASKTNMSIQYDYTTQQIMLSTHNTVLLNSRDGIAPAPDPALIDTPYDTPVPVLTSTPVPAVTFTTEPAAFTPKPTNAPRPTDAPVFDISAYNTNKQFIDRVVELVNIERSKAGLPALVTDPKLTEAAMYKCQDISNTRQFSHDSPTYGKSFVLMDVFGIKYASWGENIASGQPTPEDVMDAWLNSPGHKDAILSSKYEYIGVGFLYDDYFDTIWSQEFIKKQ